MYSLSLKIYIWNAFGCEHKQSFSDYFKRINKSRVVLS